MYFVDPQNPDEPSYQGRNKHHHHPRAQGHQAGGHQPPGASSPDPPSGVRTFHQAYSAITHAMARDGGCMVDADQHVHGDTHCIVSKVDLALFLVQLHEAAKDTASVQLAIAQEGLNGVRAHLDDCERKGVPPSARILRGLLAVFNRPHPEPEDT